MRIGTLQDLGLVIRERRRELALGQAELAQRVGVSRQWIVEVERGKSRAEAGLLLRTLRALGLAVTVGPVASDAPPPGFPDVDIDAIVEHARGGRGE